MEKKRIEAVGDPSGNYGIFYRNDTTPDDFDSTKITRIEDLEQKAPDNGLLYKTTTNYDGQAGGSKQEVSGILKIDKKSNLWQSPDELIKKAMLSKLQESYSFLNEKNLRIDIDRAAGTVSYACNEGTLAAARLKVKGAETGFQQIPFEALESSALFHIDPQFFNATYPELAKSNAFQSLGLLQQSNIYMKVSDTEFCEFDKKRGQKKNCVKLRVNFNSVAKNALFQLAISQMKDPANAEYLKYLKANKVNIQQDNKGNSVMKFIKLTDSTFDTYPDARPPLQTYRSGKNKGAVKPGTGVMETKSPNTLPVLFNVFIIQLEEIGRPSNAIDLAKVPTGSIFTVTDDSIGDQWAMKQGNKRSGIFVPFVTEFIKMTDETFTLYKAGSTNIDELRDYVDKVRINQEKPKKEKPIFDIIAGLDFAENNWDTRKISDSTGCIVKSHFDFAPKRASTLDEALDTIFKKYPAKQDPKGDYVQIPNKNFTQEVSMINPKLLEEIRQKQYVEKVDNKDTTMGNSEKFTWFYATDGNVRLTKYS